MLIVDELREFLKREENETVGTALGGSVQLSHNSYSVSQIRDFLASRIPSMPIGAFEQALFRMQVSVPGALLRIGPVSPRPAATTCRANSFLDLRSAGALLSRWAGADKARASGLIP